MLGVSSSPSILILFFIAFFYFDSHIAYGISQLLLPTNHMIYANLTHFYTIYDYEQPNNLNSTLLLCELSKNYNTFL